MLAGRGRPLIKEAVLRYPSLVLFAALGAGIALGQRVDWLPETALAVSAACWGTCLLVVALGRPCLLTTPCLILTVAASGLARHAVAVDALPPHHLAYQPDRDGLVEATGVAVSDVEDRDGDGRFTVGVHRVAVGDTVFRVTGRVLVSCRAFVPDVRPGDAVTFTASLRAPGPPRNPGAFDYAAYLGRKGVARTARVRDRGDLVFGERAPGPMDVLIGPLRRHVRATIRQNLSGSPAALVEGVLLGDKSRVPHDVREAFGRSGVSHVLAVSGLHVGLVAAGVFFTARSLGGGAVACGLATTIAVWVYALMTGLPASVVRAAGVASLVAWSPCLQRRVDALNALGAAGFAILTFRPLDLADLGFQLSFAATGGILLLHRSFTAWLSAGSGHRWRRWVAAPVAVSVAAQLATAPLIVAAFGQLSVIATAANMLVVPLMSGAVGIGLLTVLVGLVTKAGVTLLNGANWLLLEASLALARAFAAPSWAAGSFVTPPGSLVAAFVCALACCVEGIRRSRAAAWVVIAGLASANVHVWSGLSRTDEVVVRVLDVGQGDGILLSFPNGRHILVDAGIGGFGQDAGERVVLPALRHLGISRLDAVVASHPHADHVGGLVSVLGGIEVGHYLESGQYYGSSTAGRIQRLIREHGIRRHVVAAGDTIRGLGEASALILHPRPTDVNPAGEAPGGLNNGSVVMRVAYGGQSILLTGDVEHETDGSIVAWRERLVSTVLKSAHHGSRTSSTPAFLRAVNPAWAAISCGIDNKFGHPSPEVLERHERLGIATRRTDLSGCLTFRMSRDTVRVAGYLDENETGPPP